MGGFFEPKLEKAPGPELLETPEMKAGITALQTLLDNISNINPQEIAGMTPAEQEAQSILMSLVNSPMTPSYKAGETELLNTLNEGYNPAESPYYSGLRKELNRIEEKGVSDIRRRSQLGGMLFSEPSQRTEAGYRADIGAKKEQTLGGLAETERARKYGAIPLALQYSMNRPELQTLGAVQQYGSLPRDIQNQQNTATYQNQLLPYQYGTPIAQALTNYQPYYQPQYYQNPSGFENLMTGLSTIANLWSTVSNATGNMKKNKLKSGNANKLTTNNNMTHTAGANGWGIPNLAK